MKNKRTKEEKQKEKLGWVGLGQVHLLSESHTEESMASVIAYVGEEREGGGRFYQNSGGRNYYFNPIDQ